jgi:hypothetical protein
LSNTVIKNTPLCSIKNQFKLLAESEFDLIGYFAFKRTHLFVERSQRIVMTYIQKLKMLFTVQHDRTVQVGAGQGTVVLHVGLRLPQACKIVRSECIFKVSALLRAEASISVGAHVFDFIYIYNFVYANYGVSLKTHLADHSTLLEKLISNALEYKSLYVDYTTASLLQSFNGNMPDKLFWQYL